MENLGPEGDANVLEPEPMEGEPTGGNMPKRRHSSSRSKRKLKGTKKAKAEEMGRVVLPDLDPETEDALDVPEEEGP